jgi:Dolichyl-phosphate-mannose-protein mannosyltransferase
MLARICASLVVLATGFRAVSDDDFARVVIAEQWAHAPRLDPTGTSWLPLPFWLTGSVFLVLGRGLDAARAVAFVTGVLASIPIYFAARWLLQDRRAAVAGAVVASIFPWSARLGVATVPELPAAALTLLAMASTAPGFTPRRRLVGALALLAAALMRYEAWLIAAGFAALSVIDASRAPRVVGRSAALVLAAAIALLGPILWILWNRHAHGDALDFLARVTAYRRATMAGESEGTLATLIAYPIAMVRHEPELAAGITALAIAARVRGARLPGARAWIRPAALAMLLFAGLALASVRDGAPTHHPERAVLVVLLMGGLCAGGLGHALAQAAPRRAWARLGAAVLLAVVVSGALVRYFIGARESFAGRADEVAIGRAAAPRVRPGDKLLVEAIDYDHLALIAAMGRPEDVVIDRDIDPRRRDRRSSFEAEDTLARRLDEVGASAFAARLTPVTRAAGEPVATSGSWGLWMRGPARE